MPGDDASQLIAGRYRIIRKIGEGGMGEVYQALDTRGDDRAVALKWMFSSDQRDMARLKREYRRMEGVSHPHLVALYGLEEHRGRPFIVMEYIEGRDFYSALRVEGAGPSDECRLRALVRPLTHAIMALHDAGRVHRDLKGKNVMVSPCDRVVVLDFGLVSELERRSMLSSSMGRIAGTPHYMAPEQRAGHSPARASDWYALGVMLFVVSTGRYPIEGPGYRALLGTRSEIPRARSIEPRLSARLDDLIARLLHWEPVRRATGHDILAWCDRAYVPPRRLAPRTTSGPLVGRKQELRALSEAFARASHEFVQVELSGPTGAGKSAVLRHFLESLDQDPGVVTLRSKCHEYDHLPFKAFDLLIEHILRHLLSLPPEFREPLLDTKFRALSRLFPALRRVRGDGGSDDLIMRLGLESEVPGEQVLRSLACEGLRGLVHRIAAGTRLIIAIDDAHWIDPDSLTLLRGLVAEPVPPFLLILVSRSAEPEQLYAGDEVEELRRRPVRLKLGPLSYEHAGELARMLDPSLSPTSAAWIAEEAQGNPLLIEEIVHHVGDASLADFSGSETARRRQLSVDALVSHRLADIIPDAARLLIAVSAAGRPQALDVLARAAGSANDPRLLLSQLEARRLLCSTEIDGKNMVEAAHPQICRSVLKGLDKDERAMVHRRLAEVLEESGCDDLGDIARHWYSAGDPVRAGAMAKEAAARNFTRHAFDRAVELYRLARDCQPEDTSLVGKQAAALAAAGRIEEATPLLLLAAQSANEGLARSMHLATGDLWLSRGELAQGLEILGPLLVTHGIELPQGGLQAGWQLSVRLGVLSRRGVAWVDHGAGDRAVGERCDLYWALSKGHAFSDPIRAGLFAVQSVLLALDLGDPWRILRSLALAGVYSLEIGETAGRAWLEAAEVIACEHRLGSAFITLCRGLVHHGACAWIEAVEDLEDVLRQLPVRAVWERLLATESLLASLAAMGDLTTLGDRAQLLSQRTGPSLCRRQKRLCLIFRAVQALAAADVEHCRAALDAAASQSEHGCFDALQLHALVVATSCDLHEGDPERAWERVLTAWPAMERSAVLEARTWRAVAFGTRARVGLALSAHSASVQGPVLEIVVRDVDHLEEQQYPQPGVALLRAGLAARGSKPTEVRQSLWCAVTEFERLGMVLHATCVRYCLGCWATTAEERAWRAQSEEFIRLQGIVRPDRWIALVAPGLACEEAVTSDAVRR